MTPGAETTDKMLTCPRQAPALARFGFLGRFVFLALLASLASARVEAAQPAAVPVWTPYGPPAGAVLDLVVGSGGQLFLAAEESGVYASRDGGRTWSWSGAGMGSQRARALAADAASGALYTVGDARLFRSRDSARSWQALSPALPLDSPPPGGDVLALSPGATTATFFLARGSRLFRGNVGGVGGDGGESWMEVLDTQGRINAVLADPKNPLSVFAGTAQPDSVPWHSADGGLSWSPFLASFDPLPGDQPPPYFYGTQQLAAWPGSPAALFAVFQYAGSFLYRSLDGGASWQLAGVPPRSDGHVITVDVPAALDTLYAIEILGSGATAGLFASRDLGDTWERVDRDGILPESLRFDPATGDFYGATAFGIARGEGGGAHWHQLLVDKDLCGDGFVQDTGAKLRFPKRSATRVYAVAGLSLYWSDDGGASWGAQYESASDVFRCAQIGDLAIDPRRDATLYVASDRGIARSTDAGATWQSILAGVVSGTLQAAAVLADGTILAGGCGVWRSADAGASWQQPQPCPPPQQEPDEGVSRYVARLVVDPARPRVAYAEVLEGFGFPPRLDPLVYRSPDGGRSWAPLPVAGNVIAIDPRAPQTLYVLGSTGLRKSADDGASWRKISDFNLQLVDYTQSPTGGDLLVDPADSRHLWAARSDGVWQSTDGGVSWQPRSTGLRGNIPLSLFADPHQPGKIEVATSAGLFSIAPTGIR